MDYSKLFLSSFGPGPAPLEGDTIANSLRFRGNQYLTRTPSVTQGDTLYTYSCWVKNSCVGGDFSVIAGNKNFDGSGTRKSQYWTFQGFPGTNEGKIYWADGDNGSGGFVTFRSPGTFRDPSAWYHCVFQLDSTRGTSDTRVRAWINGVEQTLDAVMTQNPPSSSINSINQSGAVNVIGGAFQKATTTPQYLADGYIADVYMIAGQLLEPTAFGQYNAADVWVPIKPDFSQSNVARYSDMLSSPTDWYPGVSPTLMFNGLIGPPTVQINQENGSFVTFTPTTPIPYTTSVRVYQDQSGTASLNGGAPVNGADNDKPSTLATGSGTIESIVFGGTYGGSCGAIEVDGVILTDPFLWSTYLTTDNPGGFQEPASNAFNGSLADPAAMSGNTGGILTWAPPSFEFNQKIEVYCKAGLTSASYIASWNGNDVNYVHDTWVTVYEGSGTIDNTFPLTITADPADQAALAGIRIDGKLVVDGVNSSFGTNGFHLDFSDPNDLGADRSGNGNHFTATGFNTDPVGIFSTNQWGSAPGNYETEASGNRYQPITAINAFNGNIASQSQVAPAQSWWYWVQDLNNVNTLRFNYSSQSIPTEVRVNGNVAAFTLGNNGPAAGGGANNWCDVTIPSDGIVNELAWVPASGTSNTATFCVELNGNILEDNTGEDYDWMQDSPTQNWATLNPLVRRSNASAQIPTYENANLVVSTADSGNPVSVFNFCTTTFRGGRYAVEATLDSVSTTAYFGVAEPMPFINDTGGWSVQYINDGNIIVGTSGTSAYGNAYNVGDRLRCEFDYDNGTAEFFLNGESQGQVAAVPPQGVDLAFIGQTPRAAGWTFNYGQQPYIDTPTAGFEALQTQNLDKPTIIDGGDHFRVLTGSGPSILSIAQGNANGDNGTGFQRGLWWIKDRGQPNSHQLLDCVRGGDLTLYSNNNVVENTYVGHADNSVAWCWKAGDQTTTNNDGSIASQVSANTAAGFSIVTYSGDDAASATIGHGLNTAPEFVIVKARNADKYWTTYHASISAGTQNCLELNTTAGTGSVQGPYFGATQTFDSDVFSVGFVGGDPSNSTNVNGNDYVAYCWHSVPGYSQMGSYTGNGSTDGPFIYTGFRPAFVMWKRTDSTANWFILDTARDASNALYQWLEPNEAAQEQNNQVPNYTVDYLSNGFKIRGAGDAININSSNYVYAAFARQPFGGKGLAPATAALNGPDYYDGILPGVSQSLRFRGTSGGYLERIVTTEGDSANLTLSCWFKHGQDFDTRFAMSCQPGGSGSQFTGPLVNGNGTLYQYPQPGGGDSSTNVFRDPSAWYHFVWTVDNGKWRYYINGELVFEPTTNSNTFFNAGRRIEIGSQDNGQGRKNQYLAQMYCIDGQALEPTQFGQYDTNGVWVPNEYTGTYGTNGFHLVMDPAYQVGDTLRDQSGNGNDFTMTGFETGDYYSNDFDWMKDGPTENHATFNPLMQSSEYPSNPINANLGFQNCDNIGRGTIFTPTSGKYYWEIDTNNSFNIKLGVQTVDRLTKVELELRNNQSSPISRITNLPGTFTEATGNNPTSGLIGCAVDLDNGKFDFYLDGVVNGSYTGQGLENLEIFAGGSTSAITFRDIYINCGQQPFKNPVPSGYQALQTANLPEAPIANGKEHFNVIEYTGNATARSITGLDFQPDLVWVKSRSEEGSNSLFDSVRGATNVLFSNRTDSQETNSTSLTSFDSNGFSLGTGTSSVLTNGNAITYVAWCWKAGGSAVTNNDGSIDSQVSANTDAGFSVVTYSGQPSNFTWGHGLNQPPEMVIIKPSNAAAGWSVYHKSLGATKRLQLNQKISSETVNYFQNTEPTDSIFSVSTNLGTGADGTDYVAYCWHSVPGYSKIGSFSGNGNADGPFVYTGFRPSFILIKNADASVEWRMTDSTRDRVNPVNHLLQPDLTNAEQNTSNVIDFLSNGFKIRGDFNGLNGANETMAYIAFAENPINISNAR